MARPEAKRGSGRGAVLAVDGGDSKTDVALVESSGHVIAALRWPKSSHLGLDHRGGLESLTEAVGALSRLLPSRSPGGRDREGTIADIGVFCMAGIDLPPDTRRVQPQLKKKGWTSSTVLRNDTFAVLRAGSPRGWGIGVVCGAGLNCVGAAPDGRTVRFASLGEISGDLASGGGWLGVTAVGMAVRAADGRGEPTRLERSIAEYFGARSTTAVMERLYTGAISESRTLELAPLVFDAAAAGDPVARRLVDKLADEIVAMVVAAARRLHVVREELDVVLGGGVFRTHDAIFFERLNRGVREVVPRAELRRLEAPPVLGAALLGLDELGATPGAKDTLQQALTHARLTASGRPQAVTKAATDGR